MGNPTFIDRVRGVIGALAWRVFLWSIRMTDEQYDHLVHAGCNPANGSPACEHGYNGICPDCDAIQTPPMKYWQHDETGRICATVLQPGERWYEMPKIIYDEMIKAGSKSDHTPD